MIKAEGPAKVKEIAILLAMTLLVQIRPAHAQLSEKEVQNLEEQEFGIEGGKKKKPKPNVDESQYETGETEDIQPDAAPEKVKPIEAEEFKTRVLKKSTSGRVLMFADQSENRPRPGKILLMKSGETEIAAVRVLKNYPGKFAGKAVLLFSQMQVGQEYRGIKKLGDKIIQLIKEREKRGKDLDAAKTDEDLAKEVSPDDNELDRGIPLPKPQKKTALRSEPDSIQAGEANKIPPLFNKDGSELDANSIELKEEDEAMADLAVHDEHPLEPYRHALTLQYASVRSVDKDNNFADYSGFGGRYAFNFWRMVMWKRRTLQDMFSAELGIFYYTITGFERTDDSVTVIPIIGTLKYSLLVGDNLSFFGYLGFIKNNPSQAVDTTATGASTTTSNLAVLDTTKAALGVGAQLKIGPAWAMRLDFGTDLFAIGAVLKF